MYRHVIYSLVDPTGLLYTLPKHRVSSGHQLSPVAIAYFMSLLKRIKDRS